MPKQFIPGYARCKIIVDRETWETISVEVGEPLTEEEENDLLKPVINYFVDLWLERRNTYLENLKNDSSSTEEKESREGEETPPASMPICMQGL